MPTATRADHPTGEDLQSFLEAAELTVAAALVTQLDWAAAKAAQDFERATGRRMLAESTASLRYYDPPTVNGLLWVDDLAAAPTLVQFVPYGGSAETLTHGLDYRLDPPNALALGQPITAVRFLRRRWQSPLAPSLLQSVQITAQWGYGTLLPEDVWGAELMRAAYLLWQQVTFATTGGVLGWKDGDRSVDYGVERWSGPLKLWCGDTGSGGTYGQTVDHYKRKDRGI